MDSGRNLTEPLPGRFSESERRRALSAACAIAAIVLGVLAGASCSSHAVSPDFRAPLLDAPLPKGIAPGTIGYILYDPSRGAIVEQHNRRLPLIPASTTKLLTVGAAFDILGPDYRFKTSLTYRGHIDHGILKGDLLLIGGEDPELHVRDLLGMIGSLREKGIREVQGRFLFVEKGPFRRERIDDGMEEEAAYNPAIGSLSLESNVLFLRWKRQGLSSEAYFVPRLPGNDLTVREKDPTDEDEREVVFEGQRQGEAWAMLRPRQPEGMRPLPVKDAGSYTARVFRLLCRTRGIYLPPPSPDSVAGGTFLAQYESRPLREIAAQIFATSDNAMTELLLLHLAAKKTGNPLDLASSATVLRTHLLQRIDGIDPAGLQLKNGSGLTSENRITAEQLVAGLLFADAVAGAGGVEPLLPVGGWSPGLLGRLNRPDETFRIVAKPGGIFYSVTLAGFLYPVSGRRLAFAILITDRQLRSRYESLKDKRSKRRNLEANIWMRQNREALDGLLADWIARH